MAVLEAHSYCSNCHDTLDLVKLVVNFKSFTIRINLSHTCILLKGYEKYNTVLEYSFASVEQIIVKQSFIYYSV